MSERSLCLSANARGARKLIDERKQTLKSLSAKANSRSFLQSKWNHFVHFETDKKHLNYHTRISTLRSKRQVIFEISIKDCPRKLSTAEILLHCCRLPNFQNSKIMAKLRGAQNVSRASVRARSCKNWARTGARAHIFWLGASVGASAVNFLCALKLCPGNNILLCT